MRSLLAIARYTFLQQFRNRLYLVVVLFGVLMMGATLLFGALAGDQEVRVILDLGLVTAELFGLATAVFGAVTLVVEEMESKTIYLILTRPLAPAVYVAGPFRGFCWRWGQHGVDGNSAFFLFLKGWKPRPRCLALPDDGVESDGDDGAHLVVLAHFHVGAHGDRVFHFVLGAGPFRQRNSLHGGKAGRHAGLSWF
jgi:hypothetical protein